VADATDLADRVVAELCHDLADDCCLLILRRNLESRNETAVPRVSEPGSS
jgi:hypothetical protein